MSKKSTPGDGQWAQGSKGGGTIHFGAGPGGRRSVGSLIAAIRGAIRLGR